MNNFEKAIEAVVNMTASISEFGDACKNGHITMPDIIEVRERLVRIMNTTTDHTTFKCGDLVKHRSNNGINYLVVACGHLTDSNNVKQTWYFVSNESTRTFYPECELKPV